MRTIRLYKYKKLFAENNLLFVNHSYLNVNEWKILRKQGEVVGFTIRVIKKGVLNGSFFNVEKNHSNKNLSFSGANAVIFFKKNDFQIINFVKFHRKLLLLGGRFSETYRSTQLTKGMTSGFYPVDPFIFNSMMTDPHGIIPVLSHHYITLIKVLQYGYNKSSRS